VSEQEDEERDSTVYDRTFLLSPEKRNHVMELWEVKRYGLDSYGDADYVHLYDMAPTEWYQRGVRLLARTTVECVRDAMANLMGADVERVLRYAPVGEGVTVIDPFAGSCNSLYWILLHLPGAQGVAVEMDPTIFAMTKANIAVLDQPIALAQGDYRALLPKYPVPADHVLVIFVAPPWGEALHPITGLDLARTQPPIHEVIAEMDAVYQDQPVLYVIQIFERLEPTSLRKVREQFAWSESRIYDINTAGMRHGILLGSRHWRPSKL
jgi:16S rRNA G966 N2-methylase RsmD